MGGVPVAANLRELRERVAVCPVESGYHHFCETQLRPSFDDPEYRNDFAVWVRRALHDRVLGEKLGVINPYEFPDVEALRVHVLDLIDERLDEIEQIHWVRPGEEFQFMRSVTVVFDTGKTVQGPEELPMAIWRMSLGSIYYHFVEARRRTPEREDDFSSWLRSLPDKKGEPFRRAFAEIDFYFPSLRELQQTLLRATVKVLEEGAWRT